MPPERLDRLSTLIQHFRIRAYVHAAGRAAVGSDAAGRPAPAANFFILPEGVRPKAIPGGDVPTGGGPLLLFFPHGPHGPHGAPRDVDWHPGDDGIPPTGGTVRATIDTGGAANPVVQALPEVVAVALNDSPDLKAVTDLLSEEALAPRCGGPAVIDRLGEVVVIRLLRYLIETGRTEVGLLAGLAHPGLTPAIVAIHDRPDRTWNLETLAAIAGMSRTNFANSFRDTVGVPPGEYLSNWRLTLARMELAKGAPLKSVAGKVGFSSSAALSRAYRRRFGTSPRRAAKTAA